MRGYVYILESTKNQSYYIGSTLNVEKRLRQHNSNQVLATKNLTPWVLKLYKEYPTIKEARQIEYRIKKLKSRKILEQIIEDQNITMGR